MDDKVSAVPRAPIARAISLPNSPTSPLATNPWYRQKFEFFRDAIEEKVRHEYPDIPKTYKLEPSNIETSTLKGYDLDFPIGLHDGRSTVVSVAYSQGSRPPMKKSEELTMIIIENFLALKNEILRIRSRIEQQNIRYPVFKPATISGEKSTKEIDEFIDMINKFQEEFTRNSQTIKNFNSNSYRLFCRLLARTLHKLTIYFTAYDETLYHSGSLFDGAVRVLDERRRFYDRLRLADYSLLDKDDLLEYESELEQREHGFHSISLLALKNKYGTVLTAYLNQCIDFHKHFLVINACEKMVSLLNSIFTDQQQRDQLTRSLERLRIPLTFPNLRLHLNVNNISEQLSHENSITSFIPSKSIKERQSNTPDVYIDTTIQDHRWLVLLGNPGSGKTTLARWLTHTFARAVLDDLEQVSSGEDDKKKYLGLTRLPILIRVSEFTNWLQHNPTSTLFDYIGQHTWYDQSYLTDKPDMIQDFVRHHHALIILIGLDEVTTFELRAQVLTLIRNFIDSFVQSSEFISAYDDTKLAKMWPTQQDRLESLQSGNVIIITSGLTGYDIQPLRSELITHYKIVPMYPKDIENFITTWRANVQTQVLSGITSELENNRFNQSEDWFCVDNLLQIINSRKEITEWASNRRLLSILCTLYARQGDQLFEKTRFYLYEQIVELVLQRLQDHQSRIETRTFKFVLSRIALHIQLRSTTGLIDEFDLKTFCRYLLKEWSDQNPHQHGSLTLSELRYRTEEFIQLLKKDTGMIATPHLSVYRFFHSSFQEYFASISMIATNSSLEELAVRFCSLYSQPQARGPLLLAMGSINSKWDPVVFNQFCEYLISYNNLCNKYVPVGVLLLFASFPDLARPPPQSIVFKALDTLLLVDDDEPETCLFQSSLANTFNILPISVVQQWFEKVLFRNVASRLKILPIVWTIVNKCETLPRWIDLQLVNLFWYCFNRFEEKFDVYLHQCLTMINKMSYIERSEDMFQDLRSYLLGKSHLVTTMDPSVLAAIIVLYGGLYRTENRKQQVSVTFSPEYMHHRNSPLSHIFIDCFKNTADSTSGIQYLIDQCHQIILAAELSDVSPKVVHSFVVLLCLNGVRQPSNYCQYKNHNALQLAIRYLKLIRFYLHDYYIHMKLVDAIDFTTIVKKIVHDDEFVVAHSLAHAFGLLVCNGRCPHRNLISYQVYTTRLVNLKLPISFDHRRFLEYDEAMRLTILSSAYCIPPRMCAHFQDIEELEKNDIDLLRCEQHPFQLLKDHPTILLIAYLPKHVQRLYTHLIKNSSPLLFVHLLIELLTQIQYMEICSLRLWILLTVLEPILIKYGLMNFLRTVINRAVDTVSLESTIYLMDTIIEQSYVESLIKRLLPFKNSDNPVWSKNAAVEEEQIRLSTVHDDNNSNDLRIYTASINFAILTDDEMSSSEAWSAVTNIKDSLWRLDAFIELSRINASLQKKLRQENHLLIEITEILKSIESCTLFLTFIAIFVRYLPYLEQISSTEKDKLIYQIFYRTQTMLKVEQEVIYQVLAHFSSLRPLICQFIDQSIWANDSNAFIDVFQLNSVRFIHVLRSSSFEFLNNTSVLLSSMYLNELSFDVHLLQNWFDRNSAEEFVLHSNMSLTSFEEFLSELNKQIEASNELRLNSTMVEKINTFLSSSLTELDKSRLPRLNLLLRHFNELEDQSTSVSIMKWLTWHSDSDLKPFAYHSALLLAQYGLRTSPILDICCELLTSNDDLFRRKATNAIKAYGSLDSHIIKWVKNWNACSPATIIRVKECLRCSFNLNQSDAIDSIIQEERSRFNTLCNNNSRLFSVSNHQISSFELIVEMTTEATEYLNKIIQQLLISNEYIDYRFFLWIINYSFKNPFISKQVGKYVNYLLKLMQYKSDKDVQVTAIRALVWCEENDYVSALWDMLGNNSSTIDESVFIACLWSLYYRQDRPIEEYELNYLCSVQANSPSETIRKASLIGLYRQILDNPSAYVLHEIYYSYIINVTYYLFNNDGTENNDDAPPNIAAQWIIEHASELLTTFVQDTFKNMCNNEIQVFDERFTYIVIADWICDKICDRFTETVRQSSFGEQAFKEALYKMSKKLDRHPQRYLCFNLYSRFKEITNQYVSMLMALALEDNLEVKPEYSILISGISHMQTLDDREVVEQQLLSAMKSISLCQRIYAAKVLYRLAITDQLSIIEVQQRLIAAIEDPWSHQKSLNRLSKGQLDYELKLLLRHLLFTKDPNPQFKLTTLDIFDKCTSLTFPTLIFSGSIHS